MPCSTEASGSAWARTSRSQRQRGPDGGAPVTLRPSGATIQPPWRGAQTR